MQALLRLFIYFWLHLVFPAVLRLKGWGSSCTAVHTLLITVASLAAEHRLWARGLAPVANGLSYPAACAIFPDGNQTCVPCIGRWISNLFTTRGV